jgi:hypothetical protein
VSYKPQPIDTSAVSLSRELQDLTQLLAKNAHDIWARQRLADGWRYGPARNDTKKEHPCLIAYDELPEAEKIYDRNTAMETIRVILSLGYGIAKS